MSWKDNLRSASFRGVPFFIEGSSYATGRRVVQHEFPDRDDPYAEDLGKISDTFEVTGHILGDDYFTIKKQLIEAVQKPGPGELIHPYYGTLFVQCGAFSVEENTLEGRIAKITFSFTEAGNNKFPVNVDDKVAKAEAAGDNALATSKEAFDNKFSILGLPGYAVDSARAKVAAAQEAFDNATKGLRTTADGIADLAYSTRNLVAEVNDLLQSPAKLSQRLQDSFSLLENALQNPFDRTQAMRAFFTFGVGDQTAPFTTATRQKEQENNETFNNFMRQTAVIKAAVNASQAEFASQEEALAQREELLEVIEEQLLIVQEDDVFQALENVSTTLVDSTPDPESDLPRIQTVSPDQTTASILLVYDLFEDPRGEEDLIKRNKIEHPGFIIGGEELEVVDVRENTETI